MSRDLTGYGLTTIECEGEKEIIIVDFPNGKKMVFAIDSTADGEAIEYCYDSPQHPNVVGGGREDLGA